MKILSIGNSFSQDATRYLYGIARADGIPVKVVNLYIGGCSLSRHFRNMMADAAAYDLEINGMTNTGFKTSIKEALLSDDWDVVTLQQQSLKSADYETFQPYLDALVDCIRKLAPRAKLLFHQTWGYKPGSEKLGKTIYETHEDMFRAIQRAYALASDTYGAGRIPSGEVVLEANRLGAPHIYRDEFHMSRGFGRYLLGLVWYKTLTGNAVENNTYRDFDEAITDEEISLAKEIVSQIQ
ncbi:MAG: DUF4886 domain-containing protein [Clostridia bacterium]|nr:DUF4886 domain-containing protein [Clostridia bacterium]